MKHFIIRDNYLQIDDNVNILKSTKEEFSKLESNFSLPIKQIEYYPGLLHELIHFNGTIETLPVLDINYDIYISKVSTYLELQHSLKQQSLEALLPASLLEAKQKIEKDIYNYASNLQKSAVSKYSDAERDRWTTTILPEAKAYSVSQNPSDAPQLTIQHIIRTGIRDTNSLEFKNGLLEVVNQVLQSNTYLINYANFIAGTRGKWLDVIRNFKQTKTETEKEAIQRLLAIDWKQGWVLLPS